MSLGSKSQKERTGRGGWPEELGEGGGPLGPGNGSYFMDTEQVGRGLHSQSARHEAGGVGRLSFLSRVELRGGSGAVCGLWERYHYREESRIERRGVEVPRGSCPGRRDSSERVWLGPEEGNSSQAYGSSRGPGYVMRGCGVQECEGRGCRGSWSSSGNRRPSRDERGVGS